MENLPTIDYKTALILTTGYGYAIKTGEEIRSCGLDAPDITYKMARCKPYLIKDLGKEGYIPLANYINNKKENGVLIALPLLKSKKNK